MAVFPPQKKTKKAKTKAKKKSLSERKAYSLTMRGIQNATGNWTAVLTREFLKSKGNKKRDETVKRVVLYLIGANLFVTQDFERK